MREQLRFIENQDGMLLFGFVQAHDGFRDLIDEIAAIVSRLQPRKQPYAESGFLVSNAPRPPPASSRGATPPRIR